MLENWFLGEMNIPRSRLAKKQSVFLYQNTQKDKTFFYLCIIIWGDGMICSHHLWQNKFKIFVNLAPKPKIVNERNFSGNVNIFFGMINKMIMPGLRYSLESLAIQLICLTWSLSIWTDLDETDHL